MDGEPQTEHTWPPLVIPTIACRQPIPLQVELREDGPGNDGGGSERRLDGVVEDLLEARRPQLARVKVPHWSPTSIIESSHLSIVSLTEGKFHEEQMSYALQGC